MQVAAKTKHDLREELELQKTLRPNCVHKSQRPQPYNDAKKRTLVMMCK